MMDDSFTWAPDLIMNAIRKIFSLLDFVAYGLLQLVYRLFFSVASSDIFASDTIMKFYSRIQIILGVFMLFQLALIILKGIVNPDSFTDSKSGIGNLIMRICVALFLLTALVPISIPSPQNEYEIQLNNNGLLFGTLYSLQHRILENNTLGRLILGTNDESESNISVASQSDSLKKASRIFATTILKGFYRINLVPEENRTDKCKKAEDPAIYNECRMCQSGIDDYIDIYKKADASPDIIIGMVNETCTSDADLLTKFANFVAGTNRYIFTYTPVLSTITAVVFIFIFISFTIDVAVRAIKLAVLRLIAPIPIISYMDPKGSKDSAFNAWVKTLTSTYLDLFVRLAIVYFVLFLIQRIIQDGIVVGGTGIIKIFSYIAIFIGMFIFAKQAPKFIRQALGLKDGDFKLFGGIGEAMGAVSYAGGILGSFNAARRASIMSDQVNDVPGGLLNSGKHLLAGITGAVTGASTGMEAWRGAKGNQSKAVMDAYQKQNSAAIQRGASGSTFTGRMGAGLHRMIQGDGATDFDAETRRISQLKDIDKSGKDLFSYLEGKGKTDGADFGVETAKIDALGNAKITDTLNNYNRRKAEALANEQRGGTADFYVTDSTGHTHKINAHDAVASKIEDELAYAAGDRWAQDQEAKHQLHLMDSTNPDGDLGYLQKKDTYNEAIKGIEDENGRIDQSFNADWAADSTGRTMGTSTLKKRFKEAGGKALREESDAAYKRQQADYGASKKGS